MKTQVTSILLALALLATGCARQELRSGDLLFVALPMNYEADTASMSSGITAATGGGEALNYIHTAIIEVADGSTWIIDATIKHGVDRYPLDTFLTDFTLKDGSYPVFEVLRLKDGKDAQRYLSKAKTFIGEPYDVYFLPDNGAMYCTELVYDSYLNPDGSHVFGTVPMNFKAPDGTMPPYWEKLFGALGVPIPQGVSGTNPQDMHASPLLKKTGISITDR